MATKSNGDWIPGTITPPSNYPNPVGNNVNMHSMDWAYGVGNVLMDKTAPAAPVLSNGTATGTTVPLSWTAVTDSGSGVTTYEIFNGATLVYTVTDGSLSYTVTGLALSTAYTFTVKAVDGAGNVSVASNAVAVTTAAS
ncbi:MAG TPA: fibronectin type III domain-containing protein [Acidimicrobiales bacterium]|nr:fibronectin type III domain-containing protein [Acidimicrobiales bacterium]